MRNVKGVDFPGNVEELVRSTLWMGKLRTAVSRFYPPYGLGLQEDQEDVVADVICRMCRKDDAGRDYIERWEPAKATFGTWMYTLVNRRCIHFYNATNTARGRGRRNTVPVLGGAELEDGEMLGVEPVAHGTSQEEQAVVAETLEKLAAMPVVDMHGYEVGGETFQFSMNAVIHDDGDTIPLEVPQALVGTRWKDDHVTVLLLTQTFGMKAQDLAMVMRLCSKGLRFRQREAVKAASAVLCLHDDMGREAGGVEKAGARASRRSDSAPQPKPRPFAGADRSMAKHRPWVAVTD